MVFRKWGHQEVKSPGGDLNLGSLEAGRHNETLLFLLDGWNSPQNPNLADPFKLWTVLTEQKSY